MKAHHSSLPDYFFKKLDTKTMSWLNASSGGALVKPAAQAKPRFRKITHMKLLSKFRKK